MEDEAHGVGTFKGVNGEFYQGEWQADKQHGVGVYRFVSGARYRGEWKYGKMDGYGIYENLEGQKFIGKYEGQMIQGKMDGLGLYCWAEGDVYIGEYSQDKRHGSGSEMGLWIITTIIKFRLELLQAYIPRLRVRCTRASTTMVIDTAGASMLTQKGTCTKGSGETTCGMGGPW